MNHFPMRTLTPVAKCVPRRKAQHRAARVPACRVATRGVAYPLHAFWTGARGWGVRCEVDIPVGSFVCAYVGRLCTNSEAELIEQDKYLFELEHFALVCTSVLGGDPLRQVRSVALWCAHAVLRWALRSAWAAAVPATGSGPRALVSPSA